MTATPAVAPDHIAIARLRVLAEGADMPQNPCGKSGFTHMKIFSLLVRRTAASLLLPASLFAAAAPPKPEGIAPAATTVTLEPFEITGSRVKRLDYETPVPVVVYSAEDIAVTGADSLGEFLQSLPFNSGFNNSEITSGGFIPGAVTANPRGLGSNRFLTLVNGRRTVPYGLTNAGSGTPVTAFNFNSVPLAAIERTEFLKDGASAIYGSDAISGVYNIILRRNYSGTSLDFSLSNTAKHDTLSRRVSIFSGYSRDGWDISVGISYQSRHSSFLPDLGIASVDYRYLGAKGASFLSTINVPSPLILTSAQATASGLGTATGVYVISGGKPTANPSKSNFSYVGTSTSQIPRENLYDSAHDQQIWPANESSNGMINLTRRISPRLSAFAMLGANRGKVYFESVPFGYSTTITGFTLPASNPYNPLGLTLTNNPSSFFFQSSGTRPQRRVTDTSSTALAGLRGLLGKDWEWETGLSYGRNHTVSAADQIRATDLQAALNGTTRDTAYNPFGPSDNPRLVPGLFTRSIQNDNLAATLAYNLTASGPIWRLPLAGAGTVGMATGYEYREESLDAHPETSNFLGTTGSTAYNGTRHTHSAFFEFSVPLQKWLELQLAGRHEVYSDFGTATKPKLSASLRLPPNRFVHVLLRGSYSESFKAPDLSQLYQSQTWALSGTFWRDPLRPQDGARRLTAVLGGSPDLAAETGKTQYVGAVFDVPAVRGLSLTVDFFDIKISNVVGIVRAGYLLSPEGMKKFPDAVVRDNSRENPGPISYFYGTYRNLGSQLYRGLDLGLKYGLTKTRFGSFRFSVDLSQILKRGSDEGQGGGFFDETGGYAAAEWRGSATAGWSHRNVSAALNVSVIGPYYNRGYTSVGWGENIYPLFNPSFTYRGFKKLSLTVAVNNVLDHRPPANGYSVRGFDSATYSAGASGRVFSLRGRREF